MLVRVTVSRLIVAMLRCEHNDLAAAALAQLAVAHIWDLFEKGENTPHLLSMSIVDCLFSSNDAPLVLFADDRQMLYEMLLLLESVSNRHKPDPLSKLVLCRLYAHLGMSSVFGRVVVSPSLLINTKRVFLQVVLIVCSL